MRPFGPGLLVMSLAIFLAGDLAHAKPGGQRGRGGARRPVSCAAHKSSVPVIAKNLNTCNNGALAVGAASEDLDSLLAATQRAQSQGISVPSSTFAHDLERAKAMLKSAEALHRDIANKAGIREKALSSAAAKNKSAVSELAKERDKVITEIKRIDEKLAQINSDYQGYMWEYTQYKSAYEQNALRSDDQVQKYFEIKKLQEDRRAEANELTRIRRGFESQRPPLTAAIDEQTKIVDGAQKILPSLKQIKSDNDAAAQKLAGMQSGFKSDLSSATGVEDVKKDDPVESDISGKTKDDGLSGYTRANIANAGRDAVEEGKVIPADPSKLGSNSAVALAVSEQRALGAMGESKLQENVDELGGVDGVKSKYTDTLKELEAKKKAFPESGIYIPTVPEEAEEIARARAAMQSYNETYDQAAADPAIQKLMVDDGIRRLDESAVRTAEDMSGIKQTVITPYTGDIESALENTAQPGYTAELTETFSAGEKFEAETNTAREASLAATKAEPSWFDRYVAEPLGMNSSAKIAENEIYSEGPYAAGVVTAVQPDAKAAVQGALDQASGRDVAAGVVGTVVPGMDYVEASKWEGEMQAYHTQTGFDASSKQLLESAKDDKQFAAKMAVVDVATLGVGGKVKGAAKAGEAVETFASARRIEGAMEEAAVPMSAVKRVEPVRTPLVVKTEETALNVTSSGRLSPAHTPERLAALRPANDNVITAANDNLKAAMVPEQRAVNGDSLVRRSQPVATTKADEATSTAVEARRMETARAKSQAEFSAQAETNALKRQAEADHARLLARQREIAESRAAASEDVRLAAMKAQSEKAAQAKVVERNTMSEQLRLGRQVEAGQAKAAQANAARAAQTEAIALRRQNETAIRNFQTKLNTDIPLSYPKAPPELKAASMPMAQPPGKIIYSETVPEMLTKENIAHTKLSDTKALVTPSPENKISRTAEKVKTKYGTNTYVDEEVDRHNYGGWANKDEIGLSRATVKNQVSQGPVLAHEVEHVKNLSNQAKRVEQGNTNFDWRNISFGSKNSPTGIQSYNRMSIDEVMAYRRSYNQYRFDANAIKKSGNNEMMNSIQNGAESSAYHYGEKLRASTAYLRSADDSLEQMMPANLISRKQTAFTKDLPLGAPSRAEKVKAVTVKEISDSSGRSVRLVKTKYEDNKEFTSLVVQVKGNNGSMVPMNMPVPNQMMNLPEKVVITDAKKYVGQALEKMDTYEVLFQKSAAGKVDFYRSYAKKPALLEPEPKPAVVGGKRPPRILGSERFNGSAPKDLDDLGIERAEYSGRSPAGEFDDPDLIGKRADGPNAEFNRPTLPEMADRRVNWVLKEHSEFSAISAADNRQFIELAAKAEKGEVTESFFVTENAVLKRLNDDVVKDKDFVTALDNLHKDVLLREIQKDPLLKDAVVASYNDYKSIGFALKKNNAQIRRLLDEKIAKTNQGFDDFLKKVETAKGWKEKSIGLSNDMRTWHHSGIGKTFQEAGLAARRSRELALESGEARLVNFADESAHYIAATDRMTARSNELAKKFKSSALLEKTPHGTALSEEAIETIRKAKAVGNTEKDLNEAVSAALKKRYKQDVSLEEAAILRSQLKDIDAVNPSLLIEKRVEINMGLHDEGLVSFDFKGQNSRNLYQTQLAILKSQGKDMKTRLEAIAEGDRIATAQLDAMKARVEKSVASLGEKYVGKDVSAVVQKSGDDGIFHPLAELGPTEKAKLARALNENQVGDAVRLTYLPKNYRNSKELIATVDRNRLVVEAEKIEKDLFTEHLVGELPDDVFKGLQVKVDLVPAKNGKSAVGISFSHASGKEIPLKAEEIARNALKDKYDISYIDRSKAVAKDARSRVSRKPASSLAPAERIGRADPKLLEMAKGDPALLKKLSAEPELESMLSAKSPAELKILSRQEISDRLDPTEEMYLEGYGGGAGYNGDLRSGVPLEKCGGCVSIRNGLKKLPAYEGVTYRGDRLSGARLKEYTTVGNTVSDKGFLSTTRELRRASAFGNRGEGEKAIFVINGNTGRSIESLTELPHEQEVLFSPGTKFKVRLVHEREDGSYLIFLEELQNRSL